MKHKMKWIIGAIITVSIVLAGYFFIFLNGKNSANGDWTLEFDGTKATLRIKGDKVQFTQQEKAANGKYKPISGWIYGVIDQKTKKISFDESYGNHKMSEEGTYSLSFTRRKLTLKITDAVPLTFNHKKSKKTKMNNSDSNKAKKNIWAVHNKDKIHKKEVEEEKRELKREREKSIASSKSQSKRESIEDKRSSDNKKEARNDHVTGNTVYTSRYNIEIKKLTFASAEEKNKENPIIIVQLVLTNKAKKKVNADTVLDANMSAYQGAVDDTDSQVFGTRASSEDLMLSKNEKEELEFYIELNDSTTPIDFWFGNIAYDLNGPIRMNVPK